MMLVHGCLESVVFILMVILFKEMYINKYGVADTCKDDLSDYENTSQQELSPTDILDEEGNVVSKTTGGRSSSKTQPDDKLKLKFQPSSAPLDTESAAYW